MDIFSVCAVTEEDESSKYCKTQGSHKGEWHFVLRLWVHGMPATKPTDCKTQESHKASLLL